MVGGDRRSPPRHKAKGGGGRGKGGCGNGESNSGGETSSKSDLTKSCIQEKTFRFGGEATPLDSADRKISANFGAHIAVENLNLHKESTSTYVKFGKQAPVQNLLQETDGIQAGNPCGSDELGSKGEGKGKLGTTRRENTATILNFGNEVKGMDSAMEMDLQQQRGINAKPKVTVRTSNSSFGGAKSWALAVEAQEQIQEELEGNRGVAQLVAGFEKGTVAGFAHEAQDVSSVLMERSPSGHHEEPVTPNCLSRCDDVRSTKINVTNNHGTSSSLNSMVCCDDKNKSWNELKVNEEHMNDAIQEAAGTEGAESGIAAIRSSAECPQGVRYNAHTTQCSSRDSCMVTVNAEDNLGVQELCRERKREYATAVFGGSTSKKAAWDKSSVNHPFTQNSNIRNSDAANVCMAGHVSVQQETHIVGEEDTIMADRLNPTKRTQGACLIAEPNVRRALDMRAAPTVANSPPPWAAKQNQEIRAVSSNNLEANNLDNAGIYKQNADFAKSNPWKRPAHVKIEAHMLGNISTDGTSVAFDEESYERNIERLERGLIGKLIGRKLPLHILDQELARRWSHVGGFRTVLMKGDCFMCIFESIEARDNILMGGPWQIMGHIIGLDRWSPNFKPEFLTGLSSPVWIRLPGLPFPFWDNKTISRIAAMIGDPLWIDAQTVDWGRSEYARVCVRLNLSTKLPTGIWIQGKLDKFRQPVEYEGISLLCFHCGIIGHKMDSCQQYKASAHKEVNGNKSKNQTITPEPSLATGEGSHSTQTKEIGAPSSRMCEMPPVMSHDKQPDKDDECYGPWILVTRKRKLQPPRGRTAAPYSVVRTTTAKEVQALENAHVTTIQTALVEPSTTTQTIDIVENMLVSSPPLATLDQPILTTADSHTSADSSKMALVVVDSHQPRSRSGKDRVSKAHFEKELLQLGPIALKSRKRKKKITIAGMEQCFKAFAQDTKSSDFSGGGDASPPKGK